MKDMIAEGISTSDDFELLQIQLKSCNLKKCYERYLYLRSKEISSDNSSPTPLEAELKDNDIAVWMSGLLCGVSPECSEEVQLIVSGLNSGDRVPFFLVEPPKLSSSESGISSKSDMNCLPGCGCDNPWSFISASLKK